MEFTAEQKKIILELSYLTGHTYKHLEDQVKTIMGLVSPVDRTGILHQIHSLSQNPRPVAKESGGYSWQPIQ